MATSTERFGFTLPSGQDPASVVPLNLNTQNIEKYLGMTQDMLAPLYDATEGTYEVDDIVTYDSVLYKCIEAVETPEDFDETKWVQTTAVSEGGGGAGAIEKTQAEYDALTPAQKTNGAIYMVNGSQELDDNYSYYSAENDTIIVRVYHEGESDQKIEWFFRGWNQTNGDMTVPSNLTAYLPSMPRIATYSANYPNATATQNGWIGFYGGNIRAWTQDLANTTTGIMYGVVDIDGGADQTNPYVDDPHIYVEGSNKIYYMGTEYANTNGGSGGGTSEGEGVEIYSEDEYIVGKWIDGKKLYQKTIKFSATSLSTNWMTIEQGVDYNLAFPEVQGLYYTSNGEPFTQSTRVFVQNGDLKIQPLNELDLLSSTLKHVITIRYTKTVETPAPAWGGSVTNNYANFIDTDNVIYSTVSSSSTDTYTATEDCYIMQDVVTGSSVATVQIDSETVAEYSFSGTTMLLSYNTYLKKGQTITVTHGATSAHTIKAFGISYGSGGSSSGSSVEYSTEEKEVGTWIDGSKLYQRTFNKSDVVIQDTNWTNNILGTNGTNINIVSYEGYFSLSGTNGKIPYTYYRSSSEYFTSIVNNDGDDINVRPNMNAGLTIYAGIITVQYTKAVS